MDFQTAMRNYGVDKPDTRYGMLLHDLTSSVAADTESQIMQVRSPRL